MQQRRAAAAHDNDDRDDDQGDDNNDDGERRRRACLVTAPLRLKRMATTAAATRPKPTTMPSMTRPKISADDSPAIVTDHFWARLEKLLSRVLTK
jgi:hypothetical protein